MKRIIISIFCSMFVLFFSLMVFAQEPKSDSSMVPVVDYQLEIQKLNNKQSERKNKHFVTSLTVGGREINELPKGVEPLPLINHWWLGISAQPVSQSDLVIIADVKDVQAHLTDDRTGIYSEFSVQVKQIFKDTGKSVAEKSELIINRIGGSVRFSSGRINTYLIHRQGTPQKNNRYIFFLNQTKGGDYFILTAYEMNNNRVYALDGQDYSDPRSALVFNQYHDVEETRFLKDLQTNLALDRSKNR